MIRYVEPRRRYAEQRALNQYFMLRKHVFCDRLGWVRPATPNLEMDEFDQLYNVYVLEIDEGSGCVTAGARLMPTTGPTLLHSRWSDMLPDPDQFRAPDLWEATRFCVDEAFETRKRNFVNNATLALAVGVVNYAVVNSISRLIAICEPSFFAMAGGFGEEPEIISTRMDEFGDVYGCGIWRTHASVPLLQWGKRFLDRVDTPAAPS